MTKESEGARERRQRTFRAPCGRSIESIINTFKIELKREKRGQRVPARASERTRLATTVPRSPRIYKVEYKITFKERLRGREAS